MLNEDKDPKYAYKGIFQCKNLCILAQPTVCGMIFRFECGKISDKADKDNTCEHLLWNKLCPEGRNHNGEFRK